MIFKLVGFLLVTVCLALVFFFEGSSNLSGAFRVLHWPAIVLTALGPIGIVLMCSEWNVVQATWKFFWSVSPRKIERQNHFEARLMHQTTQQMYRLGTKALDGPLKEKLSHTVQRVFRRISARMPLADVINLVEKERDRTEAELRRSIRIVSLGLRMAPSVGMLGTILGMMQLLGHLQDPSSIGSHMSLALLTTFYGLFFSLVLWTPIQNYLDSVLEMRTKGFDQVVHWLEIMEERKPIQYFAEHIEPNEPAEEKASSSAKPVKKNEKVTASPPLVKGPRTVTANAPGGRA